MLLRELPIYKWLRREGITSDFISIFHSRLCLKNRRPSAEVGILQCLKSYSVWNLAVSEISFPTFWIKFYRIPVVKIRFLYQIDYLFGDYIIGIYTNQGWSLYKMLDFQKVWNPTSCKNTTYKYNCITLLPNILILTLLPNYRKLQYTKKLPATLSKTGGGKPPVTAY